MKLQRLLGGALLALSVVSVSCDDDDDPIVPDTPTLLTATLDDGNERPPVTTTTNATGRASFEVTPDGIDYTVWASNTSSRVTLCHIHVAAADASGPVIVNLCSAGTTDAVTTETQIATGTITHGTAVGTAGISPLDLDALMALILEGNAYVNVHTSTNPGGEVRGQIVPVP